MPAPMEPIEVVRAFNAAMETMDFDRALAWVSDDLEYLNGPNPAVRGPQGVRTQLEPFFAPIVANEFVILRESVRGSTVFMERLDRHRIAQGWFELPVAGVYEVENGRIVYWHDYFDMATIRDAMSSLMGGGR